MLCKTRYCSGFQHATHEFASCEYLHKKFSILKNKRAVTLNSTKLKTFRELVTTIKRANYNYKACCYKPQVNVYLWYQWLNSRQSLSLGHTAGEVEAKIKCFWITRNQRRGQIYWLSTAGNHNGLFWNKVPRNFPLRLGTRFNYYCNYIYCYLQKGHSLGQCQELQDPSPCLKASWNTKTMKDNSGTVPRNFL